MREFLEFLNTPSFGIISMVIVGISWCLVGLVAGDAPKKNVDMAFLQLWSAIVSIAVSILILFLPGADTVVPLKWFMLTLGSYFFSGFLNFFMLQLMSKAMQSGPNGIIWSIIQSALVFPFIVGMVFFNTGSSVHKITGIILLLLALVLFGIAKDNSSKGGNSWRYIALLALLVCAVQQNLATFPAYFPECRKVGSLYCTMATAAGTMAASLIFIVYSCKKQSDKKEQLKNNLRDWNLWKYIVILQGFGLLTSYIFLYPGMFVMGRYGMGMLCYPMMVGSCIVSFTLTSMFFLKEKVKIVQISALILCISGLVFLAIG